MPFSSSASTPGRPASAVLGTSGSSGLRAPPGTASARSRPLRMWSSTEGTVAKVICTWPEIRSATDGPPLR
jgi:hypothetical protein